MAANPIANPYPYFNDLSGLPLTGGFVYIGLPNQDPQTNPMATYTDAALTTPFAQPLRTLGGYIALSGTPANAFPATTPYSIRLRNKAGIEVFYQAEVHDEIADFLASLAGPDGAGKLGFSATETYPQGSLGLHGQANIAITDAPWNVKNDGSVDAATGFTTAGAYISAAGGGRIRVPAGEYVWSNAPNLAIPFLHLDCDPGVIFHHTGTGPAFKMDASAISGGIGCMLITGSPLIRGNANTTDGVYSSGVHHSQFDFEIENVGHSGLHTAWAVCNRYRIRVSPSFRLSPPVFSPMPTCGIYLDKLAGGQITSACEIFVIAEGIGGYGVWLENAAQNEIFGTSEGNVGGVHISSTSSGNTIDLDMESNTVEDLQCLGFRNILYNLLSTSTSIVGDVSDPTIGQDNLLLGGTYNALTIYADRTVMQDMRVANNGGAFVDNNSTTTYRNVRNLTTASTYPDQINNPRKRLAIFDAGGDHLLIGSADQIGGLPGNCAISKTDGAIQFWMDDPSNPGTLIKVLEIGPGAIGAYGAAGGLKPTITGSKGGNAALASYLASQAARGWIVDSTT